MRPIRLIGLIGLISLIGLAGGFFLFRGGTSTPASSLPSAQSSLKLYSLGEDQKTLLPPKTSFKAQDQVKFILTFKDSSTSFFPFLKTAFAEEASISAQLLYNNEEAKDVSVETKPLEQDKFSFSLQPKTPGQLRPGQYQLKVSRQENGQTQTLTQDFSWGVLAINPNKSIYTPGEIAKIGIGVLNDSGRTICDAPMTLEITDPDNIKTILNEANKFINKSGYCKETSVTNVPDYLAGYKTGKPGIYKMHLEANNGNGPRSLDDSFEVRESMPFDIERSDYPMRIYPPAEYTGKIIIKANQDFVGMVEEEVPEGFKISQISPIGQIRQTNPVQQISWNVDWKKGQTYTFSYSIKFPQISPEFYLIGPLKLVQSDLSDRSVIFQESRQWQIASDAITTQFMEPGTDATQDLKLWSTTAGTGTAVSSDTTVAKTGPRSVKADSGAGNGTSIAQLSSGIADSGTRISAYFYFTDLPASGTFIPILAVQNSGFNHVASVRIVGSTSRLQLINGTTTLASGTTTLSTGVWYRISIAYVITSTTNYKMTVWLDGNQEISVTNGSTLAQTTSDRIRVGWVGAPGASKVMNFDNVYVDNGTEIADPGDIRVTSKLPNTVNNNNFDTTGGTGAVNEQPLSETNYMQDATSSTPGAVQDYTLQTAAAGDVDIGSSQQATIVSRTAWVWAKRGSGTVSTNATLIDNGSETSISLGTTSGVFKVVTDGSSYPSNAAGIGIRAIDGTADTFFYEGGTLIAYKPVANMRFDGLQMNGIQIR